MKKIKIEVTTIPESQIKFKGDESKMLDYVDLIDMTLDIIPQGGFTPSDIRERIRIQDALDKAKEGIINLEDADYNALVKIVGSSRWTIRNRDIHKFLEAFKK